MERGLIAGSPAARGFALLKEGKARDAEIAFREALKLRPDDANALMGLGIVAHRTGHHAAALELFDRALSIAPNAALQVNRGNALAMLGRRTEAIAAFRSAIDLDPELPGAHINLANALHADGDLDGAVGEMETARQLAPESVETLNNLGNFYKDQGRLDDALGCYESALRLDPLSPQAFSNRLAALKLDVRRGPQDLLEEHRRWGNWFSGAMREAPFLDNSPEPGRRLRIGYVSPDCHTALPAFLDHILAGHDRAAFEVYAYFNNPQPPECLAALDLASTSRVMRGVDDSDVARQIQADGIDLLIDIAGHTGHNRLGVFARHPAPVALTWLDYLGTTGVPHIDYRVTDAVADPPGSEANHSELLLRLPHVQWSWSAPANASEVTALPASSNRGVTFGSFNHVQKLTDATLALWRALLESIPTARLLLAGVPNGIARERVERQLGVESDRVSFLARMPEPDYRAAIGTVDIALDPLPFSGATTTLDALWQGVPVLTLPGDTSCSRSTASLLTATGLTDWIATDRADFVARAQARAADLPALAATRAGLRDRLRASPVMDHGGFVRDLEALYRTAWASWCDRERTGNGPQARLRRAKKAMSEGSVDTAMASLAELAREKPEWEIAKRDLVQAALAWGRAHPEARAAWQEPPPPVARTRVSAVVCSIRPELFDSVSRALAAQFAGHEFEVIGIHDATSLCEGYNRGAARARGDVLVFCHDDIAFPQADFGQRVLGHLVQQEVVGIAGAERLVDGDWTHAGSPWLLGQVLHRPLDGGLLYYVAGLHRSVVAPAVALDGVFMAIRRDVWEGVRFDEATFDGFHLYDVDFTWRAAQSGHRVAVAMDLLLTHYSTGRYGATWQRDNRRFLDRHPGLSNLPSMRRHAPLQVKLQTLEQVERLHAALRHFGFGSAAD